MNRFATTLILAAFVAPACGQEVAPAVEGDGHQVQSIELAKDTISISVESAASLSLGGDNDHIDGGVGVTVNEIGIAIGDTKSPGAPNSATEAIATPPPSPATKTPLPAPATLDDDAECSFVLPRPADLAQALEQGYEVATHETDCTAPVPGLDALIAVSGRFFDALSRVGAPVEGMVAITIDNGLVIAHYPANLLNL